jgi:hypothetical protein
MAKNFEKLIFGGLHEKHAVQRGIWVPTQHSLCGQGKPRKTLIELAGHRTCLLFKTQLNCIGLPVPHRKYIASPLRAQQVNVIYRFVTIVY